MDVARSRRRATVRMPTKGPRPESLFSADDSRGDIRAADGGRLGRYELLFQMASGGMATMHLAQIDGPQQFEKLVAIKKIHDHLTDRQDFVDMFLDEARISARIQHPNVVQLFDLGEDNGAYFIAMEYVHGRNLAGVLHEVTSKGYGGWTWPLAVWVVSEAAAGLHAAHELTHTDGKPLGLVHRDISPQNLLVSFDGNVKVTDFGIAYAAERITHTQSGVLKGKIPYMAPEQASGQAIDRRADVFALGTVLYESVCLRRLFKEPSEAASLSRVLQADVPPPRSVRPDLPESLETILLKALARDPAQRYQTAGELRNDLRRLLVDHQQTVDAPQMAAVMRDLFDSQKRQLDRYITQATGRSRVKPAPTAAAGAGAELTGEARGQSVVAVGGTVSLRPVLAVVVVVLALMAAAVAYFTWVRRTSPPAPPTNMPAAAMARAMATRPEPSPMGRRAVARPVPAEPLLVKFRVHLRHGTATIHVRGKAYHQNELQLLLKPTAAAETVRVEAPRYETVERTILVAPGAELSHVFRLTRRHRGRRRKSPVRAMHRIEPPRTAPVERPRPVAEPVMRSTVTRPSPMPPPRPPPMSRPMRIGPTMVW